MLEAPFRGTEAVGSGLLTRHQLYGPRFQRIFPDVYLPVGLAPDLANRSKAAYLLVRDRGGVLVGYSAAVLLGADCAARSASAEVLVPARLRAQPGLRIHRGCVDAADATVASGCRVTTQPRTAWDLARRLPLVEAVVAVDALARRGAFAPTDLLDRRAEHPGPRGCRRLDDVLALADPRAESPMESRLRVGLIRAGLPPPEVQYQILDEYDLPLARVDLAYPTAKLAVEYDGSTHFDRRGGERDRQRDAELAGHGWQTLRLSRDDVYGMPQTVQRIRTLLALRAPSRPADQPA